MFSFENVRNNLKRSLRNMDGILERCEFNKYNQSAVVKTLPNTKRF